VSVKKLDKLSWSRSGRPVAPSDRKVLLGVLRRAKKEGRVTERAAPLPTIRDPRGDPPG
jgi:hypothetical protein